MDPVTRKEIILKRIIDSRGGRRAATLSRPAQHIVHAGSANVAQRGTEGATEPVPAHEE